VFEQNERIASKIRDAHRLAAQAMEMEQQRQRLAFDKGAKLSNLQIGDLVLITNEYLREGQCKKFGPKYRGPYKLAKIDYPNVELKQIKPVRKRTITVHLQRVKKFYGNIHLLQKMEQGRLPELNRCATCKLRYRKQDGDSWIGCDGCLEWFHFRCQDVVEEPDRILWYCRRCVGSAEG
jgi:hypothetical protein